MFTKIIRIGTIIFGLVILLEAALPLARVKATIDSHELTIRRYVYSKAKPENVYRLHLLGGKIESCDVGLKAFNSTQDGDSITIGYSRFLKKCTSIEKDGLNIHSTYGWRWFYAVCAIAMLLGATIAPPSFVVDGRKFQ